MSDREPRTPPQSIADVDIEHYAAEAERGYDVDLLIGRRGKRDRPTFGQALGGETELVQLEPDLRDQLDERAKIDGTTPSEVIRRALRDYLRVA